MTGKIDRDAAKLGRQGVQLWTPIPQIGREPVKEDESGVSLTSIDQVERKQSLHCDFSGWVYAITHSAKAGKCSH